MQLNPLLKRQLLKVNFPVTNLDNLSKEYFTLINLVNESYNNFEEDVELLERSIDISSEEYNEQIRQIKSLQSSVIHNEKMAGIGQLSAGIAHEINNPLGFIRSNIETLSKYIAKINGMNSLTSELLGTMDSVKKDNIIIEMNEYLQNNKLDIIYSDLNELLSETTTGIDRISNIVKSLLSFSRKENVDEFEDYEINKGIKDTLTIAYNEIKYFATVNTEFNDIPTIKAKAGEINQVILNMLMNAVYAIKKKNTKGEITIKTYVEDKFVCCEIKDNGCGISREYLSRIFEPFFTTKPVGEGTGLGLSISHNIIVNKHNGKLDVNSIVGEGTSFLISLPIDNKCINEI